VKKRATTVERRDLNSESKRKWSEDGILMKIYYTGLTSAVADALYVAMKVGELRLFTVDKD
jgi:hypothetical protein